MKKYKDIKILKEKSSSSDVTTTANNNSYTFIDDIHIAKPNHISSTTTMKGKVDDEHPLKITIDSKREDKYKKKKVVNKNESKSKFKALKFSNPSQRNHSSVYE